jgi:hypothetical protein
MDCLLNRNLLYLSLCDLTRVVATLPAVFVVTRWTLYRRTDQWLVREDLPSTYSPPKEWYAYIRMTIMVDIRRRVFRVALNFSVRRQVIMLHFHILWQRLEVWIQPRFLSIRLFIDDEIHSDDDKNSKEERQKRSGAVDFLCVKHGYGCRSGWLVVASWL